MKPQLALLGALLLLAGCSTTWSRPGASTTDLLDAMAACRDAAKIASVEIQPTISGEATLTLPDRAVSRDTFDRCMSERGYARGTNY